MIYAYRSDKGLRKKNEDSFYVPDEGKRPLVIVADGMGGHIAGEVASRTAIDRIVGYVEKAPEGSSSTVLLRQALNEANKTIFEMALSNRDLSGMGTTAVVVLLYPAKFAAAHIGDSRIYHYDGQRLRRVTKDHSFVQELVSSGVITEEQARVHPQRNIITRAIGTSRFEKADASVKGWKRGDILLLCSDGLCGSVDDGEMEMILRSSKDLLGCCDALTERALSNGSSDNITVVLVQNTEAGI